MAFSKNTLIEPVPEEKTEKKPEKKPEKKSEKKPEKNSEKSEKKKEKKSFSSHFSFFFNEKLHKIIGVFFLSFSVYLLIAFVSHFFTWTDNFDTLFNATFYDVLTKKFEVYNLTGNLGAKLSYLFFNKSFGVSSFLFVIVFFILGFRLAFEFTILPIWKTLKHSFFYLIWISICLGYVLQNNELFYGYFGYFINAWLESVLGKPGTGLLLFFTLVSFLIAAFNMPLKMKKKPVEPEISDIPIEIQQNDLDVLDDSIQNENLPFASENKNSILFTTEKNDASVTHHFSAHVGEKNIPIENNDIELTIENNEPSSIEFTIENDITETIKEHKTIDTPYDPTLDLSDYKLPPLDLLKDYTEGKKVINEDELKANSNRIVNTLKNYQIEISHIKATIGPTVTLYELIPAPGVRISKIKNLEDDIALSLSALGIRIIAPIPGKGTIGIEVPNLKPEIVSMKSMLASDKFQNSTFELPIALGKTISNEEYIANLASMPHLLMAGATGQGKSVGINAILASLLYKKHPSQIKFVLVDPKKVELTLFSKIERHYLAKLPDSDEAIITDTKKVVRTLNSLCMEMDDRYTLLKDAGVRNIKEYNVKFINRKLNPENGHKFLPYIILVVDEFADFIMTAGKEVELPIARLAQLARAIGIHLVIATQRPSVNIITGTIKANFPARIAFRVTSKIDSRTILDTGGADQLIGRGDMLLSVGSDIIRLQCPFIDTPEVEKITEYIGEQRAYPTAFALPECIDEENGNSGSFDSSDRDELFEDAARLIVQHQQGSTSLIQRKMKLGYNRAGRIIDQLEAAGIVGPFEGSKAREVYIKDPMSLEQKLQDMSNKF